MKFFQLFLVATFLLAAGIFAEKSPRDSSGKTVSSTDGDLIFDDGDNSILPAEQIKKVTPAASPTAKPTIDTPAVLKSAAVPAATHATGQILEQVPAQKVTDEELILDGGDEDLLGNKKALRPKTPPVGDKTAVDTMHTGSEAPPGQAQGRTPLPSPGVFADSAVSSATTPVTAVKPPPQDAGKEHAINFARNQKEYRSPKLAMLMSLILPGSGQVYAKSNLWAAAFGFIEAAVVSTGLVLSSKASKVKKQARDFANQHYSATEFGRYSDTLKQYLQILQAKYPQFNADSLYEVIFVNGLDSTFLSDARAGNDDYYSTINGGTSSPFIRGWDDVEPPFSRNGYVVDGVRFEKVDSSYLVINLSDGKNMYGISDNQQHYDGLLRDSRNWADHARSTFLSLLINHAAASVMAGIAAKKHNDALLGKESFWRRIDLEQQFVFTGSETAPGYAMKVEF